MFSNALSALIQINNDYIYCVIPEAIKFPNYLLHSNYFEYEC